MRFAKTGTLAAFTLAAATMMPAVLLAQEPTLVRAGDGEMSCQALATEINELAGTANAPKPKKRGGLGFLRVLSAASPLLGKLGDGTVAAVTSQASALAQQEASSSRIDDAVTESLGATAARPGIVAQRQSRLTALFEQKGC